MALFELQEHVLLVKEMNNMTQCDFDENNEMSPNFSYITVKMESRGYQHLGH